MSPNKNNKASAQLSLAMLSINFFLEVCRDRGYSNKVVAMLEKRLHLELSSSGEPVFQVTEKSDLDTEGKAELYYNRDTVVDKVNSILQTILKELYPKIPILLDNRSDPWNMSVLVGAIVNELKNQESTPATRSGDHLPVAFRRIEAPGDTTGVYLILPVFDLEDPDAGPLDKKWAAEYNEK